MGTHTSRPQEPQQQQQKPSSNDRTTTNRFKTKPLSGASVGPQQQNSILMDPTKKSKEFEDHCPTQQQQSSSNIMKSGYELKPSDTCMW